MCRRRALHEFATSANSFYLFCCCCLGIFNEIKQDLAWIFQVGSSCSSYSRRASPTHCEGLFDPLLDEAAGHSRFTDIAVVVSGGPQALRTHSLLYLGSVSTLSFQHNKQKHILYYQVSFSCCVLMFPKATLMIQKAHTANQWHHEWLQETQLDIAGWVASWRLSFFIWKIKIIAGKLNLSRSLLLVVDIHREQQT